MEQEKSKALLQIHNGRLEIRVIFEDETITSEQMSEITQKLAGETNRILGEVTGSCCECEHCRGESPPLDAREQADDLATVLLLGALFEAMGQDLGSNSV